MPKQLSDEEVVAIVQKAIEDVIATSTKEMGKMMVNAKKELAGRTDMIRGPQTKEKTKPHMTQHCCCTWQGHPWLQMLVSPRKNGLDS